MTPGPVDYVKKNTFQNVITKKKYIFGKNRIKKYFEKNNCVKFFTLHSESNRIRFSCDFVCICYSSLGYEHKHNNKNKNKYCDLCGAFVRKISIGLREFGANKNIGIIDYGC